jgi:hypothetical protein
MKTLTKKIIAVSLILSFSFGVLLNCYGSFPLVRTIYNFNGSIGGPSKGGGIVRSIVMILLTIIPVYGISFFIDVIILNSIEFWSGSKMNLGMNKNDLIELKEVGDRLEIHSKIHNLTLYAFRNEPGKFFVLKDNQYIPIETKIVENKIYIIDSQENVILSKELSQKELAYIQ